jgi:hypothetical protein
MASDMTPTNRADRHNWDPQEEWFGQLTASIPSDQPESTYEWRAKTSPAPEWDGGHGDVDESRADLSLGPRGFH